MFAEFLIGDVPLELFIATVEGVSLAAQHEGELGERHLVGAGVHHFFDHSSIVHFLGNSQSLGVLLVCDVNVK